MSDDPLKAFLDQVVADAATREEHEKLAQAEQERKRAAIAAKITAASGFIEAVTVASQAAFRDVTTALDKAHCKCDVKPSTTTGYRLDESKRYQLYTICDFHIEHPKRKTDSFTPESIITLHKAIPDADPTLDVKVVVVAYWRSPESRRAFDVLRTNEGVDTAVRKSIADALDFILKIYGSPHYHPPH